MRKTRVSHYRIRIQERYGKPQRPFCAVFLSDLHDRPVWKDDHFWAALEKNDPAVIFCGGDMLTRHSRSRKERAGNALKVMELLQERWPVYAVHGNHEDRLARTPGEGGMDLSSYEQALRDMGVTVLNNTVETVRIEGLEMNIAGFDLPMGAYRRSRPVLPDVSELKKALGEKDPDTYTVLLAHHPDAFEAYREWGSDLVLSGHIHGGLIVLPFLGGVAGGSFRLFPKYCRGSFAEGNTRMIVTAGIGEHTPFLRVNNPYEIVVLEFCAV